MASSYTPPSLGKLVSAQCRHLYARRGFDTPILALQWNTILPEALSRFSVPSRLSSKADGSTELIVAVVPAKITEMSYFAHLIKDHINTHFSLLLIDKVSFVPDASLNTLLTSSPTPETPDISEI